MRVVCRALVHIVAAQADFPVLAAHPPSAAPRAPAPPAPPAGPVVVGRLKVGPVWYHVLLVVVWFGPWPTTLEWLAPIVWAV